MHAALEYLVAIRSEPDDPLLRRRRKHSPPAMPAAAIRPSRTLAGTRARPRLLRYTPKAARPPRAPTALGLRMREAPTIRTRPRRRTQTRKRPKPMRARTQTPTAQTPRVRTSVPRPLSAP